MTISQSFIHYLQRLAILVALLPVGMTSAQMITIDDEIPLLRQQLDLQSAPVVPRGSVLAVDEFILQSVRSNPRGHQQLYIDKDGKRRFSDFAFVPGVRIISVPENSGLNLKQLQARTYYLPLTALTAPANRTRVVEVPPQERKERLGTSVQAARAIGLSPTDLRQAQAQAAAQPATTAPAPAAQDRQIQLAAKATPLISVDEFRRALGRQDVTSRLAKQAPRTSGDAGAISEAQTPKATSPARPPQQAQSPTTRQAPPSAQKQTVEAPPAVEPEVPQQAPIRPEPTATAARPEPTPTAAPDSEKPAAPTVAPRTEARAPAPQPAVVVAPPQQEKPEETPVETPTPAGPRPPEAAPQTVAPADEPEAAQLRTNSEAETRLQAVAVATRPSPATPPPPEAPVAEAPAEDVAAEDEPVEDVPVLGPADLGKYPPICGCTNCFISSPHGMRCDPIHKRTTSCSRIQRFHDGNDWAAPSRTPVRAPCDGEILRQKRINGYGNQLVLLCEIDGKNYHFRFHHLQGYASNARSNNKYVKAGAIIAYTGQTGRSTGPHLDHEIHIVKNPRKVIETGGARRLRDANVIELVDPSLYYAGINSRDILTNATTRKTTANKALYTKFNSEILQKSCPATKRAGSRPATTAGKATTTSPTESVN